MTSEILLQATGLTKSYAGVRALRGASLELRAGEVHALVGENGAGKSTLIKVLTGAVRADGGEVRLAGRTVTDPSPRRARALGIAAIYQQPALFPELTVAENVALGLEGSGLWGRVDWRGRRRRAAGLLAQLGAGIDPDTEAGRLGMAQQQLVEIARALGASARVLIMDEPTASLPEEDARNLFRVISDLRARGVGIVYISHRLEELPRIADRVSVLRDGETIATRRMSEVSRAELIQLMVGRALEAVFPKQPVAPGEVVLELRDVGCAAGGVHGVSLAVRAGEIVGLAGLVGAGRTELARTIFGLTPADGGEIRLRGQGVRIDSPARAIAHGIAYLPEDRRRHGVILPMALAANVTLASLDRLSPRGVLDFRRERQMAADCVRRLGIKAPAVSVPVATLSGGNQQKVALGRWLATHPSVLVLDEPTQGIDVGAKAEIHALMSELAGQGAAIVMISSELPEILGMSDRVAVMRGGTLAGILERGQATPERLMAMAFGHDPRESAPEAGAAP